MLQVVYFYFFENVDFCFVRQLIQSQISLIPLRLALMFLERVQSNSYSVARIDLLLSLCPSKISKECPVCIVKSSYSDLSDLQCLQALCNIWNLCTAHSFLIIILCHGLQSLFCACIIQSPVKESRRLLCRVIRVIALYTARFSLVCNTQISAT